LLCRPSTCLVSVVETGSGLLPLVDGELLAEGEGSMLEYKEGLSTAFARALVAFANSAGGRILLGVRDDGTVVGVTSSGSLLSWVRWATMPRSSVSWERLSA